MVPDLASIAAVTQSVEGSQSAGHPLAPACSSHRGLEVTVITLGSIVAALVSSIVMNLAGADMSETIAAGGVSFGPWMGIGLGVRQVLKG